MRTILMSLVVTAALVSMTSRSDAHATCWSSSGCSPHCQTSSDTGCNFYNCQGYFSPHEYYRQVSCPPGSQPSNNNCPGYYVCTDAWADENHNVNTGGLSCSAWPC